MLEPAAVRVERLHRRRDGRVEQPHELERRASGRIPLEHLRADLRPDGEEPHLGDVPHALAETARRHAGDPDDVSIPMRQVAGVRDDLPHRRGRCADLDGSGDDAHAARTVPLSQPRHQTNRSGRIRMVISASRSSAPEGADGSRLGGPGGHRPAHVLGSPRRRAVDGERHAANRTPSRPRARSRSPRRRPRGRNDRPSSARAAPPVRPIRRTRGRRPRSCRGRAERPAAPSRSGLDRCARPGAPALGRRSPARVASPGSRRARRPIGPGPRRPSSSAQRSTRSSTNTRPGGVHASGMWLASTA